jgi:hypothetical protein
MKKIVTALSIILAFAMFNSSAKATDTCGFESFQDNEVYWDCTCENYQCSGYRWYRVITVCGGGCDNEPCPESCYPKHVDPYARFFWQWVEYECYTPRFGCDVGADCNERNPIWYGEEVTDYEYVCDCWAI